MVPGQSKSAPLVKKPLVATTLAKAIAATFVQRGMAVPTSLPIGLTDEFAIDASRQALWRAFLRKNELAQQPLSDIVATLHSALEPALLRAVSLTEQPR